MALFPDAQISIAFDLYGCPNRCRHCYLGRLPGGEIPLDRAVDAFSAIRAHVDSGAEAPDLTQVRFFASWVREPDFSPSYRDLRQTEFDLNRGEDYRANYELLSIWRLARDETYAAWAYGTGIRRCQITLSGLEDATDWFYRRSGAFSDVIQATERLLGSGIVPRWQLFLSKRILPDLQGLLHLAQRMCLVERAGALGDKFVIFLHDPSPIGEAADLEPLRIQKTEVGLIPAELIETSRSHMGDSMEYRTEAEWIDALPAENRPLLLGQTPEKVWFLVDANWDVYPNMGSMAPDWWIGNLQRESPATILSRYRLNVSRGQAALNRLSLADLVATCGERGGERVFMGRNPSEALTDVLLSRYLKTDRIGA